MEYISEELKKDKKFVIEAINKNAVCIKYCCKSLKNDMDVMI